MWIHTYINIHIFKKHISVAKMCFKMFVCSYLTIAVSVVCNFGLGFTNRIGHKVAAPFFFGLVHLRIGIFFGRDRICVYVHACGRSHTRTCTCTCTCTHARTHTLSLTHAHRHTHAHMHAHTLSLSHTHTHIHTHART